MPLCYASPFGGGRTVVLAHEHLRQMFDTPAPSTGASDLNFYHRLSDRFASRSSLVAESGNHLLRRLSLDICRYCFVFSKCSPVSLVTPRRRL